MTVQDLRFLVVVCDPVAPSGLIGETILEAGAFYDTILPAEGYASQSPLAFPGLPTTPEGYAGLIILGGRMSANDEAEHPHFPALGRLAQAFDAEGKPVLGACLGMQILTRAYGGAVWRMEGVESGFFELEMTEEGRRDPLFEGLDDRPTFFQNHGEACDLPAGGVILLSGGACAVQAFRLGRAVYGFQFHIEVSLDIIREWMRHFGATLYPAEPRLLTDLDADVRRYLAPQRRTAREILRRWIALAPGG